MSSDISKQEKRLAQKWLRSLSKPAKKWVNLTIYIAFFSGLLLILQLYFLAHISYEAYLAKQTAQELSYYFIGIITIVIFRAFLSWLKEVVSYKTAIIVKEQLRMDILKHITNLGPIKAGTISSANLISSAMEQVDGITGYLTKFLPQITLSGLIPFAILIFIFPNSIICGILLIICAPLIPIFMIIVGLGAESENQKHFKSLARMSSTFLDTLQGLTTLKLFNKNKTQANEIFKASDNYRKKTMKVLKIAFLSSAVLELFSAGSIALVAIYLGMGFINTGADNNLWWSLHSMTLQGALFILLLAPEFFMPLRELSTHYHAKAEAVGAALEISKIFAIKNEEIEKKKFLTEIKSINIQNLNVNYDTKKALKNINLQINKGDKIAIIGESGAGKSTLINTILGFVDYSGSIKINNDIELNSIEEKSWLKNISWLGQNATLFKGTIKDNLLMGNKNANEQQILNVLKQANLEKFINQSINGLNTKIGEQNIGISGGQAQRLALARAYIKEHNFLLLDEPTASLDKKSEDIIINSLKSFWNDKTVLILTHKLQFLDCVDKIIVLENGEIIEQGTFKELLANKESSFYSFYKKEVE